MSPIQDLLPDSMQPRGPDREVIVDFWCPSCSYSRGYVYQLPVLREDVAKNALFYIRQEPVLTGVITLNSLNLIARKGVSRALDYLQEQGVIYDRQGNSFKLTLLGLLLAWHGS